LVKFWITVSSGRKKMGLLDRLGLRTAASAETDAATQSDEITLTVLDDTHTFETDDGRQIWCGGYSPIDEDGHFLKEAEHHTSDPRAFFCHVAGVSFRPQALPMACFETGSPLALRREPDNSFDPNAVAVYDGSGKIQVGYVPAELAPTITAVMHRGVQLVGYVLREYRDRDSRGMRLGIHIAILPAGPFALSVKD
jgi:HIRAN domain